MKGEIKLNLAWQIISGVDCKGIYSMRLGGLSSFDVE